MNEPGTITLTITQDEGTGVVRTFTSQMSGDATWKQILEETIWLTKGMTYILPDTDKMLDAIDLVHEESLREQGMGCGSLV